MSSAIWNRLFSGSAAQPADHGEDSSAQRPAGDLTMKGVSLKWSTSPARWKDSSPICAEHLHDAPLMQKLAISKTTLREIPWRDIMEHVLTLAATDVGISFDHPKLLTAMVEAAGLSTLQHLASYLHDWNAVSGRVQSILDWHSSPKEMCERSRPGAFLADCMITELKIREHGAKCKVHYHVVYNAEYYLMGHEMGIVKNGNSSANNVGNQLECLCWVALEEDRPLWIIALVWHAAQLEQRKKRKPAATVILSTESDSDVHPVHETQAATAQRNSSASRPASPPDHPKPERVHIPALIELEAGHVEAACGMVYEAHLTRGFQLEQDMEDAKQSFNAAQASRAASIAAAQASSSSTDPHRQSQQHEQSASSATQPSPQVPAEEPSSAAQPASTPCLPKPKPCSRTIPPPPPLMRAPVHSVAQLECTINVSAASPVPASHPKRRLVIQTGSESTGKNATAIAEPSSEVPAEEASGAAQPASPPSPPKAKPSSKVSADEHSLLHRLLQTDASQSRHEPRCSHSSGGFKTDGEISKGKVTERALVAWSGGDDVGALCGALDCTDVVPG